MWWWKLDRRQKLRRVAASLWTTPLIMLFPLWLGALYEPSLILEFPGLYVLFFGLPFAAAAIFYWLAARVPRATAASGSRRLTRKASVTGNSRPDAAVQA